MTIKNCFVKCDSVQKVVENDEADLDEKYAELFKELAETNEIEMGWQLTNMSILIMNYYVFILPSIQRWAIGQLSQFKSVAINT